jgi:hypothetical protein
VPDFVAAWDKVMNLDRFDLARIGIHRPQFQLRDELVGFWRPGGLHPMTGWIPGTTVLATDGDRLDGVSRTAYDVGQFRAANGLFFEKEVDNGIEGAASF